MPRYWMVSDRDVSKDGLGGNEGGLSWWTSEGGDLSRFASWTKVSAAQFRKALAGATGTFPVLAPGQDHTAQQHLCLYVHGYDNSWDEAAARYQRICGELFEARGLGLCVLFTWPSKGHAMEYLPDRADAVASAPDLADLLRMLYDWMAVKQLQAAKDPAQACRAKTSIIAHSMGNFVLQKAMQSAWTRKNRPMLVSLVNQLLMVAADVDNDLFGSGEAQTGSDGDAIANLCYRVTALYTGRDPILGMSAGLKHFGKRRLGRSGLDASLPVPDNVWAVDCSGLIPADASNIHSAYFESPKVMALMAEVLQGLDRKVIQSQPPLLG
ncbi:MAG TPA: alpha/beta hydrolase [Holophagaceae bacterium]|nr:alpha/beta hydrolase [Holophagaceae bacterium]